jgi:hypothetical protein
MKCRVVFTRRSGVALPRYEVTAYPGQLGELSIRDERDEGLYRVVKVARLKCGSASEDAKPYIYMLFEPHIVWLENGRFTLVGFERSYVDGKRIEYAQSWIIKPETGEPEPKVDYRR